MAGWLVEVYKNKIKDSNLTYCAKPKHVSSEGIYVNVTLIHLLEVNKVSKSSNFKIYLDQNPCKFIGVIIISVLLVKHKNI